MSAYVIAHYDIHDFEMWTKYAQSVIPNIMDHSPSGNTARETASS